MFDGITTEIDRLSTLDARDEQTTQDLACLLAMVKDAHWQASELHTTAVELVDMLNGYVQWEK